MQQRFDTILRVSQAIVDRQRHFFEHGEVAMRPLVLREIAETLGLHESTVSRVTTQKFMFTPRGIFELKYFFGSHVATETGGACFEHRDPRADQAAGRRRRTRSKPLSDSQISEILGQQGIVVARRTVAKYRESMQILPVNLRKIHVGSAIPAAPESDLDEPEPDRPSPRRSPPRSAIMSSTSSSASRGISTT